MNMPSATPSQSVVTPEIYQAVCRVERGLRAAAHICRAFNARIAAGALKPLGAAITLPAPENRFAMAFRQNAMALQPESANYAVATMAAHGSMSASRSRDALRASGNVAAASNCPAPKPLASGRAPGTPGDEGAGHFTLNTEAPAYA
jgi:hypothetical protein